MSEKDKSDEEAERLLEGFLGDVEYSRGLVAVAAALRAKDEKDVAYDLTVVQLKLDSANQTIGALKDEIARLDAALRVKDEEIGQIKAVEFPQKVEAVAKANKIAGLRAARDAPVADAIFTNRAKLEGFHLGVNAKVKDAEIARLQLKAQEMPVDEVEDHFQSLEQKLATKDAALGEAEKLGQAMLDKWHQYNMAWDQDEAVNQWEGVRRDMAKWLAARKEPK